MKKYQAGRLDCAPPPGPPGSVRYGPKCSICRDLEPFHVHNGKRRIDDYFTVGRGMSDLEAARLWKDRALTAERELRKVKEELPEIRSGLDAIESHMAWLIKADQRFARGQRVEWSRAGRKRGYPHRKIAQQGSVKGMDDFSLVVLLDGYKKPHSFHHSFFNPVQGPKLF